MADTVCCMPYTAVILRDEKEEDEQPHHLNEGVGYAYLELVLDDGSGKAHVPEHTRHSHEAKKFCEPHEA